MSGRNAGRALPVRAGDRPPDPPSCANRAPPACGYFLLRRCTRVFRSSLRCFFLAIRFRRFLMTEPTKPPSLGIEANRRTTYSPDAGWLGRRQPPRLPALLPSRCSAPATSARGYERALQIPVDRLLGDAERAANPDRFQLTRVHEPVDGHLGDAHDRGHFGHGQELDVAQRCFACSHLLFPLPRGAECAWPDSAHQSPPSPA